MKTTTTNLWLVVGAQLLGFCSLGATETLWPSERVRHVTCSGGRWPGQHLDARGQGLDLSGCRDLQIVLSNRTDQAMDVSLSVKSAALQGCSPGGAITLPPQGTGCLACDLAPEPWVMDRPLAFNGMNGYPQAVGGESKMFDLRKVTSFHLFRQEGEAADGFTIRRVTVGTREGAADRKVFAAEGFCPFVDRFGQFKHLDWPGKIHAEADFQAAREAEDRWLAEHAARPGDGLDQYGGWAKGPQLKATGYFRAEKVNGRWWFVDPDGHLFWSLGIDCVRFGAGATAIQYREDYFDELPARDDPVFGRYHGKITWKAAHGFYAETNHVPYATYDFSAANFERKYGPSWRRILPERFHRRLHSWGVNTIANWSDSSVYGLRKTPYTVCLSTGGTPRRNGSKGWWGPLPDPDRPEFERTLRNRAREMAKTMKEDPWCLGVFVDNELSWNDLPDLAEVAEKYFATVRRILKEELPNHLYLGARIAWGTPEVYRACARHCDVVSVNVYARTMDRELPADADDRPILNGEFHFGALDRGLFHTGLVATADQHARAEAFKRYVRSCRANPRVIGTHWFQLYDQPLTGRSDGENYQIGFLDGCDTPYPEIIAAAREVSRELYDRESLMGDPVEWSIESDQIVTRGAGGSGFAFCGNEQGRTVSVSARVSPRSCANEDWSTLGVAIHADARNFWHLALVKHPEANGSRHSFELAMMQDGEWSVQARLERWEERCDGDWEYGRDYDFVLKLDPSGIRGEITAAGSGKRLYSAAYAFTAKACDCGRPALHVTGAFKGAFTRLEQSVADLVPEVIPPIPAYPRDSAARAVSAATGFFRVEENAGRWTAIDPNGASFTVLGVDHVHPWGMFCESLGYSPYERHIKEHYPNTEAWADETLARLRSWGFTALGAGCDVRRLAHRGLVHTIFLNMGDRLCYGDEAWWIRKCLNAPCTAFPNVFHPDFARACEWVAAEKCAQAKDDPWLFGYFIDNELAWWGSGGLAEGMFNAVNALAPKHTAKQALDRFVAGRPVTPELKEAFLAHVAERYFAVTTAAIRKYDPNHLILGCRFAGLGGAHDKVWRAAAKHCDIVTFNCYPWADLDRNIVLDRQGGAPIREAYDALYAKVRRPMLVTEWSFPALDTGRPCYHGAGQRFRTQALRVQATELFAKTMLALPYFIGYDYFMWVDQPAPGMNRFFPEDSNYGLVQEDGTPHAGITDMFARLQKDAARWRTAGLPPERAYEAPPMVSERERFVAAAKGEASAIVFCRAGAAWTLSNDVGLMIKGEVHKRTTMASAVALDGRTFGSLGGLVELQTEAGRVWMDAREVKDVRFTREGVCGVVTVTAEAVQGKARFALTLRYIVAPGEKDFVCEIASVRNLGSDPLQVVQLYLRPFAAEQPEGEVLQVPNLWKGAAEAKWKLRDGATYGLLSRDSTAGTFRLWLNEHVGQHPDAIFVPEKPLNLEPGCEYCPLRPMSARMMLTR